MSGLTPMMEQYQQIKTSYQDAILFFRLGDFYEMFFQDAIVASKELGITLTARDGGREKVPMCGVPYHAANTYIAKLINKGFKIAICEQVEDPKAAKGIVKREVVQVITPGTVLDSEMLEEKKNNYLVSLYGSQNTFGLACCDVSTGEFKVCQLEVQTKGNPLFDELIRLQPAECLLPEKLREDPLTLFLKQQVSCVVSFQDDRHFNPAESQERVQEHFGHSLEAFGCAHLQFAITAASALLKYLQDTQKSLLTHINKIVPYSPEGFMLLDAATRRNLELTSTLRDRETEGSLLGVMDLTVTAVGGRMLKHWLEQPLLDIEKIQARLDATEVLVNKGLLRSRLRQLLGRVYDLERLNGKIASRHANARDLLALLQSLKVLPQVAIILKELGDGLFRHLEQEIDLLEDVVSLIETSIVTDPPVSIKEGGIIKEGFDQQVDRLREAAAKGKQWIASLQEKEREKTGIKSLKVGFNKVFGYYIEVTKPNLHLVPDYYERKQTLANAERFVTKDLKEYEEMVLRAEDKITELEYQLFCQIRDQVAGNVTRIQQAATILGTLDVFASLAELAVRNNYVKPAVNTQGIIDIYQGRHPVVEASLNQPFVPNDTRLNNTDRKVIILTGPNMAGKSTYIRTVALLTIMAQMGSFIPAAEANIAIVDRVFARVGASDDLRTGRSTFMVEMHEVANILNNATPNSLIILDEVGRGTSTFDGLGIAWALTEYIVDKIGAKTLFATHYHELTALESAYDGIKNYCTAVEEQGEDIVFLRKIVPGGADRSYGIHVAKLAGIPPEVTERAKAVLLELEAGNHMRITGTEVACSHENHGLTFREDLACKKVMEILRQIDVLSMTPLEAMQKLQELHVMALDKYE